MNPTVALPLATPSTYHFTAVFVVPEIVALNCCTCVNVREAVRGLTTTVTVASRFKAGKERATASVRRKCRTARPLWLADALGHVPKAPSSQHFKYYFTGSCRAGQTSEEANFCTPTS